MKKKGRKEGSAEKSNLSQFLKLTWATLTRTDAQAGPDDYGCSEQWVMSPLANLLHTPVARGSCRPHASPEVRAEALHSHQGPGRCRAAGPGQALDSKRLRSRHTSVSDLSLNLSLFSFSRGAPGNPFPGQGLRVLAAHGSHLDTFTTPAPRSHSRLIKPGYLETGLKQPSS